MKKSNQLYFIKDLKRVHNNKYNYNLVEYNGVIHKIKIICPKHGQFEQIARDHKNGQGCPKCGKIKRYNKIRLCRGYNRVYDCGSKKYCIIL